MDEVLTVADLDIAAFLRARLDEREQQAERLHDRDCVTLDDTFEGATDPCDCPEPAFVLDDVAAKRQLVELHKPVGISVCDTCHSGWTAELNPADFPCPTLRLLALPFAGHPDYREEWKP